MRPKHFLNFENFSREDLSHIIDRAIEIKSKSETSNIFDKKTLGLIFQKPSTRTRVSFEVAMNRLGGSTIFLSSSELQISRGEPIPDTSKVLSSMVDAVVIRNDSHEELKLFSENSSVPVINGLTDLFHPCQILADLMTYQEEKGSIQGKKIAWIGDGCNVCQTYMQAAEIFDFELSIATPAGYEPSEAFSKKYKKNINFFNNPMQACQEADVVVTDVWTSMGQESEKKQRESSFKGFQVDQLMMNQAKADAVFMHCLPAYRGIEVSSEVIDGSQSVVWSEAENRLHAQKSLLLYLIED